MKKRYEKPAIVIESFLLSTAIASGCTVISDTQSSGNCAFDFSGLKVFLSGMTDVCSDFQTGDGEFGDGVCYHVPIETNSLFNS